MEPTDKLSGGGGHSRSGDYGCPAETFDQLEQEEDLMPSLFMLFDSPPSSLWLPLPHAEGFAGLDNFGDWQISPLDQMPNIPMGDGHLSPLDETPNILFSDGQISPLNEVSPNIPFGDVQISSLDYLPNIPFSDVQISPLPELLCIPGAIAEETNYAAASAAPLVAKHGTGTGQFSSNLSLSSTTSDQFDEEEVQKAMVPWQLLLHQPMAPDGLLNTTINGDLAARRHGDAAVPPLVQQGNSTTADDLPHPQQQVPQKQTMPTILTTQPSSPTPVINHSPEKANHAASAPMGLQAGTLIPAAPQDQEADILSRALTQRRAFKSRGLPSQLQDGSSNLFGKGMDMIRQFVRYIHEMMDEEKHRSTVLKHFWRSHCKHCDIVILICKYCKDVMDNASTIGMFRHLEICECYNNIQLLLVASSGASKETQRSSQTLQIKEIAENPSGVSEPIETDNRNCATATWADTQATNAVVLSQLKQHQLLMDREGQEVMALIHSSHCCFPFWVEIKSRFVLDEPNSLWDLIIRLSESSCCSSATNSTHGGFRLKFIDNDGLMGYTSVHVRSSAAWAHVITNPQYIGHGEVVGLQTRCSESEAEMVLLETRSDTVGSSYLASVVVKGKDWASAPAGCAYPWQCMYLVLCSLGFRKEFATYFVLQALALVNGCYSRLWSPSSSNKGKSIVEQAGNVPSGKRRRKPAPPRSKVWNHFAKEVVVVEGSKVTVAKCKHCRSELKAGSASHGTSQLARHIRSRHPEHAESL